MATYNNCNFAVLAADSPAPIDLMRASDKVANTLPAFWDKTSSQSVPEKRREFFRKLGGRSIDLGTSEKDRAERERSPCRGRMTQVVVWTGMGRRSGSLWPQRSHFAIDLEEHRFRLGLRKANAAVRRLEEIEEKEEVSRVVENVTEEFSRVKLERESRKLRCETTMSTWREMGWNKDEDREGEWEGLEDELKECIDVLEVCETDLEDTLQEMLQARLDGKDEAKERAAAEKRATAEKRVAERRVAERRAAERRAAVERKAAAARMGVPRTEEGRNWRFTIQLTAEAMNKRARENDEEVRPAKKLARRDSAMA